MSTRKHKLKPVPSPRRSVSVCEPVACSSSSVRPSLISVLLLLLPWILIHIYSCLAYICIFYILGFFVFLFGFVLSRSKWIFFNGVDWGRIKLSFFFLLLPSLLFPLTACVTPACLPPVPSAPLSAIPSPPPVCLLPCSSSQPARTFTGWSCAVTATTTATTKQNQDQGPEGGNTLQLLCYFFPHRL